MKSIVMKSIFAFLTLIIFSIACASSNSTSLPDISKAQKFSLISSKPEIDQIGERFIWLNGKIPPTERREYGGNRAEVRIAVDDITKTNLDQRAHTAMNAAIELQKQLGLDVIVVWLEADAELSGKGFGVARVQYSPNGKGMSGRDSNKVWEIEVSGDEIPKQQIECARRWYQHNKDFQNKNGLTDEKKLKAFLEKQYGFDSKQPCFPYSTIKPYVPKV